MHDEKQQALGDTTRSNLGFVLSHEQFPVTRLVDLSSKAEQAGFDCLWTSDHFQPWQDNQGHAGMAWVTLAAAGQRTQRIPFGTGVTCPTFRYHPAIVAQAFASLGILYPGRVFLGLGSGEALNEQAATGQWGDYAERRDRLVEAIHVIRQLWTGETVNHKGDYFQLENARLYDIPEVPVPIYIAAEGPKSMRMAGEQADGLISDGKTIMQPEMRKAFEDGACAAGKDPSAMPLIAEFFTVAGTQQEAEQGAEIWRFLPKAWNPYVNVPNPVDIRERAEEEVPIKEVVSMMTVSEDPQQHIDHIQKLLDGGVTTLFIHSPQADQEAFIRFYGEQVLPKVSRK